MRDRLIELLNNEINKPTQFTLQSIADHLLANGVIVPPCKIYDDVWFIAKKQGEAEFKVFEGNASCIEIRSGWYHVIIDWTDYQDSYRHVTVFDDFGKSVFLTKEEAEKAFSKMKGSTE